MAQVKSLQFVFENCESVEISMDNVDFVRMDGITESISVLYGRKVVRKEVKDFALRLKPEAKYAMDRLGNGDITSVNFLYDDKSSCNYYMDYEDDGQQNIYQETKISDAGYCYVVVSAETDIESWFGAYIRMEGGEASDGGCINIPDLYCFVWLDNRTGGSATSRLAMRVYDKDTEAGWKWAYLDGGETTAFTGWRYAVSNDIKDIEGIKEFITDFRKKGLPPEIISLVDDSIEEDGIYAAMEASMIMDSIKTAADVIGGIIFMEDKAEHDKEFADRINKVEKKMEARKAVHNVSEKGKAAASTVKQAAEDAIGSENVKKAGQAVGTAGKAVIKAADAAGKAFLDAFK